MRYLKSYQNLNESKENQIVFDKNIIKEVFTDLSDKYNIEIEYDDLDYMFSLLCVIKNSVGITVDNNSPLLSPIEKTINRALEYYYEETGIELSAFITNSNYDSFFKDDYGYLTIYFDEKVKPQNSVNYEFFIKKNHVYHLQNEVNESVFKNFFDLTSAFTPDASIYKVVFTEEEVDDIKDMFQDIVDEFSLHKKGTGDLESVYDLYNMDMYQYIYQIYKDEVRIYIYYEKNNNIVGELDNFKKRLQASNYITSFTGNDFQTTQIHTLRIRKSRPKDKDKSPQVWESTKPFRINEDIKLPEIDSEYRFTSNEIDDIKDLVIDIADDYNLINFTEESKLYSSIYLFSLLLKDSGYAFIYNTGRFKEEIFTYFSWNRDDLENFNKDIKGFRSRLILLGYFIIIKKEFAYIPNTNNIIYSMRITKFSDKLEKRFKKGKPHNTKLLKNFLTRESKESGMIHFDEYHHQYNSFTKDEIDDLQDVFRDMVIDELNLTKLRSPGAEVDSSGLKCVDGYYTQVFVTVEVYFYIYLNDIESHKIINQFIERVENMGDYTVMQDSLDSEIIISVLKTNKLKESRKANSPGVHYLTGLTNFKDFVKPKFDRVEIEEIKDIFQDIIDEFNLIELDDNNPSRYFEDCYCFSTDFSTNVGIQIQLYTRKFEKLFNKMIDDFIKRIESFNCKVTCSQYKESTIITIRKNEGIQESIMHDVQEDFGPLSHHPSFEKAEVDDIKDIFTDISDEFSFKRTDLFDPDEGEYFFECQLDKVICIFINTSLRFDEKESKRLLQELDSFEKRITSMGYEINVISFASMILMQIKKYTEEDEYKSIRKNLLKVLGRNESSKLIKEFNKFSESIFSNTDYIDQLNNLESRYKKEKDSILTISDIEDIKDAFKEVSDEHNMLEFQGDYSKGVTYEFSERGPSSDEIVEFKIKIA